MISPGAGFGGPVEWPAFEIDGETKRRLLNGLDDIGLTLKSDAIEDWAYERERERHGAGDRRPMSIKTRPPRRFGVTTACPL